LVKTIWTFIFETVMLLAFGVSWLPKGETVFALTVYNTLGQQVAQLVNEQQQAGYHDVVLRGDGFASGVYFYRLDVGSFTSVKKLILLK
jgi:hypothetical protein